MYLVFFTIFSFLVSWQPSAYAKKNTKAPSKQAKRVPSSEIPERREFPLNTQIEPCDDFYGHVCSEVIASFKLRSDRSSHTFSFSDSFERILEKRKAFLNNLIKNKKRPNHSDANAENENDVEKSADPLEALRKKQLVAIKNIFTACTDEKAEKHEEGQIFSQVLKELAALKNHEQFKNYVEVQDEQGGFNFVEAGNISNLANPDFNDLYLDAEAVQTMPEKTYYADEPKMQAFKEVLQSFIKLIHPQISAEEAQKRAIEISNFEKEFTQTYPLPAEFRKLITIPSQISVANLQNNFPHLPISGYLKHFAQAQAALNTVLAPENKELLIRDFTPENFKWLNQQLSGEVANLDLLKDWYAFKALAPLIDTLYPDFFNKYYQFTVLLGASPQRPNRIERCTNFISRNLSMEFDNILLPQIFPDFDSTKFGQLIEKIRNSIIQGVNRNSWMSAEAKTAALLKMNKADLMLAQPKLEADWNFLPEGRYEEKKPWANAQMVNLQKSKKSWQEISQKRNKHAWAMSPLAINAYYMPPNNQFVLPIGILQYPFYDAGLSDVENLGAVGAVVGHELGHGIDDQGSKYDSDGVLKQWMSAADLTQFKTRTQRLVDQFNKAGHNGELTLGENIGDLVGVTFAYNAAFPSSLEVKPNTADQKSFFIQYGRLWCQVMRPEQKEFRLKTDPHSLGWARVNEQMKHQKGFSEAFSCKPSQALFYNPETAVSVW